MRPISAISNSTLPNTSLGTFIRQVLEVDDVWMMEQGFFGPKGNTFLWVDPAEENPQFFTWYEYEKTLNSWR